MEDTYAKEDILDRADLTNLKFKVYTYVTAEHNPGTLIVHPDLSPPFDDQVLFEMDKLEVTELSIRDILNKGFIKLGDTDMMERMDIEYPLIPNSEYAENRITGKHMDVSPAELNSLIPGVDFNYDTDTDSNTDTDTASDTDPESDAEYADETGETEETEETDRSLDFVELRNSNRLNMSTYIELDSDEGVEDAETVELDDDKREKMDKILEDLNSCKEKIVSDVDQLLSEF